MAFPGSPLAAKKEELEKIAWFWPDIEKSRVEAKRLLKEAGAEGLSFELLNRDLDNPFIRKVGNNVLPSQGLGTVTGNVNLVGAAANFVLPLMQSVVRPYLIGGVGVYNRRVSQDVGGTIDEFQNLRDEQTDVGYNGGIGLSIGGLGPSFFLEARYVSVATAPDRTKFIPVVLGFSF